MFARAVRIHTAIISPARNVTSILQRPSIVARSMATGSKVYLKASQQPQFYAKGLRPESAEKASQLLQENHEKHHIFFNQSGFHV
jgi:UDP-N-acetyl-D-mannosaminuronic acid transferase (WecB/TagA/CpsF family)